MTLAAFETRLAHLQELFQQQEALRLVFSHLRCRAQGGKGCGKARTRLPKCERRLQALDVEIDLLVEEVLREEDVLVQTLPHKLKLQVQSRVSHLYHTIDNAKGAFGCAL
jgi:hypothetical protein